MTKKIIIIFILLNFLELTSTLKYFKLIDRKKFIQTIPLQLILTNNILYSQKNKLKEYINYEYKNNISSNSLIKHFLFNEKIDYNKSNINLFNKKNANANANANANDNANANANANDNANANANDNDNDNINNNIYDIIYIKTFFTMFLINNLATVVGLSIF